MLRVSGSRFVVALLLLLVPLIGQAQTGRTGRWVPGPAGTDQLETPPKNPPRETPNDPTPSPSSDPNRPTPSPCAKNCRLAVATVLEKQPGGCVRGVLAHFQEREIVGSSAYDDFRREMKKQFPTGNDFPYESWSLDTTFAKPGEVVIVVQFNKQDPMKKCRDTYVRFFKAKTYDQAWDEMEREATKGKWQGVHRLEVWPEGAGG